MTRVVTIGAAWLAILGAADADRAARGILTGAALIVGVVGALVSVYVSTERRS